MAAPKRAVNSPMSASAAASVAVAPARPEARATGNTAGFEDAADGCSEQITQGDNPKTPLSTRKCPSASRSVMRLLGNWAGDWRLSIDPV
jgi:hypothetical protein